MDKPREAKLRWVSAKDPRRIEAFVTAAGTRIAFGYSPVWVESEKRWYYWFVLDDRKDDLKSAKL